MSSSESNISQVASVGRGSVVQEGTAIAQSGRAGKFLIGQRLGPCKLESELGSGATSTVYCGRLVTSTPYLPIGSQVAVKVMHPSCLDVPSLLERFYREAEIGKRIDHPSIIRTHDAGNFVVDGVPIHYLVLEYVQGRTLRALMRQHGALADALLRQLALQIAGGLSALHAIGATHRDLKPTNILLTPDYSVKLMDLGLALWLDNQGTERLTRDGGFVGTLMYAPPEQIRCEVVTAASDLYSLGVILYEAATTVQPFHGRNTRATIQRHLQHVPPKMGSLNSRVTPLLEEVVARLMLKEPSERFGTAEALIEVLEQGEESAWWQQREHELRQENRYDELRRLDVSRAVPFVGRFTELETLHALLRDASRSRGRVVLLEGEAGIGKTRLVDAFLQRLAESSQTLHVLYGAAQPRGSGNPLFQAVHEHLGEFQLESQLQRYLSLTTRLVPAFAALLRGRLPPADVEPLPKEALQAVLSYLACSLAGERPVLWIVEDLQFAGQETLDYFRALAREVDGHPILLIGTCRSGTSAAQLDDVRQLDHCRKIHLSRLSERQVVRLLDEMLASTSTAEQLGPRLAVRADGNPFFIGEIVHDLISRGNLRPSAGGAYSLHDELAALKIPTSVRELLETRLAALSEEQLDLLSTASLQGYTFDPDLVALMLDLKRLQVLDQLAAIERRSGVVWALGTDYRFDQHQLPEMLAARLSREECCAAHRRLAEAYEERERLANLPAEEISGREAVFLCEHFLRGGDVESGSRTLLRALDFLARRYQHESLLELSQIALRIVTEPALRCDVLLRQAECLDLMGYREEENDAAVAALEAARAAQDAGRVAWAEIAQARLLMNRARYWEARGALRPPLQYAERHKDDDLHAEVLGLMGSVSLQLGEFEDSLTWLERRLKLAQDLQDLHLQAACRLAVGGALLGMGRYEEALSQFDAGMDHVEQVHSLELRVRISAMLGLTLRNLGDYERARSELGQSLRLSKEIGFRQGEGLTLGLLGRLALDEGKLEEAEEVLQQGLQLARLTEAIYLEGYFSLYLGDLAFARGDLDQAERLYHSALEFHQELSAKRAEAEIAMSLARLFIRRENLRSARPLLLEASDLSVEYSLDTPGILPQAYLALIGEAGPETIETHDRMPVSLLAELHLVLYQAGAGDDHREQAGILLRRISGHLSGPAQRRFWVHNPVAATFQQLTQEAS